MVQLFHLRDQPSAMAQPAPLPPERAKFFIDHLFLPPKLPEGSDDEAHAGSILLKLCEAAQAYSSNPNISSAERHSWLSIVASLEQWYTVWDSQLSEEFLYKAISKMKPDSKHQVHITIVILIS